MRNKLKKTDIMKSSEYHQFYLGILLNNQDFILDVYNKQIGLMYNKITKELCVPFTNAYNLLTDTSLVVEGFIIGKSFDVVDWNFPYELPELIKKKLNENFYVKYAGDLFYILNKPEYGQIHKWSDVFIIGFENDSFICVGETNKSCFEEYKITENEIIESAAKRQGLDIYNEYTFSLEIDFYKLKQNLSYKIEIDQIKTKLYDFLYPLKREKYILGAEVYNRIIIDWTSYGIIQKQLFYVRDNILLMKSRLKYLCSLNLLPENIYKKYCDVKKSITKICSNFERNEKKETIVEDFKKTTQKEVAVLTNVLEVINNGVVVDNS